MNFIPKFLRKSPPPAPIKLTGYAVSYYNGYISKFSYDTETFVVEKHESTNVDVNIHSDKMEIVNRVANVTYESHIAANIDMRDALEMTEMYVRSWIKKELATEFLKTHDISFDVCGFDATYNEVQICSNDLRGYHSDTELHHMITTMLHDSNISNMADIAGCMEFHYKAPPELQKVLDSNLRHFKLSFSKKA